MRKQLGVLAAVLTATCLFTGGCSNKAPAEDESQCKAIKPGAVTSVNKMCVIMNEDPVDPAVANAEWKGQKVGFCCKGCIPRWNKMTDEQKDGALAKAIAAPVPKQ